MEGQVAEFGRLDTQVLERLRLRINDLIKAFSLHFVRGDHGPPDGLVDEVGERLVDPLGQVDMSPMTESLALNKFFDFGHGIILRPVEFEGLGCSVVVV